MKSSIATIAIAWALIIPVMVVNQSTRAPGASPQPTVIADAVAAKTGSQKQQNVAMRTVRAAAVQISPVLYSREGTVETVVRMIHELHQQGVQFATFPETVVPYY